MQKQYGKLTADQFRGFVDQLPVLQREAREARRHLESRPDASWDGVLTRDYCWSWIYEFPFAVHLAAIAVAFGLQVELARVASLADPQQHLLDEIGRESPFDLPPKIEMQHGLGLVLSLSNTVNSICIHGRTLSALVGDVIEDQNSDSLFKAVSIDRTVVSCPVVSDRIAKAELRNEVGFFKKLGRAMCGPTSREMASLSKMKFALHILKESELNDLSSNELEYLMVNVLDAYANVPEARKNLRAHYDKFRKFTTI